MSYRVIEAGVGRVKENIESIGRAVALFGDI